MDLLLFFFFLIGQVKSRDQLEEIRLVMCLRRRLRTEEALMCFASLLGRSPEFTLIGKSLHEVLVRNGDFLQHAYIFGMMLFPFFFSVSQFGDVTISQAVKKKNSWRFFWDFSVFFLR